MKRKKVPAASAFLVAAGLLGVLSRCIGTDAGGPAAAYYIDAENGNDENSGKSPDHAWRSLDKVNGQWFSPGDRILFKSGTAHAGSLRPRGNGVEGRPIVVDRYGEGALPRIDAEGKYGEALLLSNQQYWEINGLELTNLGQERLHRRYGVRLSASNYGTVRHLYLRNLFIHDVNGTLRKEDGVEGHGILFENVGLIPSRFDDLSIEKCRIERVDRNGIGGHTPYRTYQNIMNTRVIIRGNTLLDIGGDGIKVKGCDGALVEGNLVRGGNLRDDGFSCGIWPFATVNSVFQFNEVCYMKGTRDGQGFDSDFDCRDNIFQYNYSHDNEGGFFLLYTRHTSMNNIGNEGTIIRYNISQNDGARTFLFGGPVTGARIHNNVVFIGKGFDIPLILFAPGMNADNSGILWGTDIEFFNNIVVSEGRAGLAHSPGPMREDGTYPTAPGAGMGRISLEANVLYGNIDYSLRASGRNHGFDPLLRGPGTGGLGFETLAGYRLREDSPCTDAGIAPSEEITADFWGNPAPLNGAYDIGAHESR